MTRGTTPVSHPADLIVIFDGNCGICQALRRRAEAYDSAGRLRFVANQSIDLDALAPGLTPDMARRALVAVRPADNRRWRGARAVFEAMRRLPGVWGVIGRIGALPPVSLLAEPFYRVIAHHRGTISRYLGLAQCTVLPDHDVSPPTT